MPNVTVSDTSMATLKKGLEKWEGYETAGEVADYLIDYAMRRLAALDRWAKGQEEKPKKPRKKAEKGPKKPRTAASPAKRQAPKKKAPKAPETQPSAVEEAPSAPNTDKE